MAPQTDDGTAKEETTTVSFADLVFAHHLRQVERYKTAQGQNGRPFESDIEQLYADRLEKFQVQNGDRKSTRLNSSH